MADVVRACADCGRLDLHRRWASMDDAIADGAMEQQWACPYCAWPAFELAAAEDAPAEGEAIPLPGPK